MNRTTKMLNIEMARISKNELLERLDSGVQIGRASCRERVF